MSIEIEKEIPVPPKAGRKYPWLTMDKGDSFLVPSETVGGVRSSLNHVKKTHPEKLKGMEFISRTMEDGSVRFWRIE